MTGLSTEAVIHKVRCEAAEMVHAYSKAHHLDDLRLQLKASNTAIKTEQAAYAERDQEIRWLLEKHTVREKELDRLNAKKQQLRSLALALDQALNALRDQVNHETDPQSLETLRLLIEKTGQRITALTDEALLTSRLAEQVENELKLEKAELENTLEEHNIRKGQLVEMQAVATRAPYDRVIRFDGAVVAMQFEFEITENNNATAMGSIIWPITYGTFTLGWSGGKEKKRVSDRDVLIAFPFSRLIKQCNDVEIADSSRLARPYPITGNVGMAEFMEQYLRISDNIDFQSGKESFREKLTFTTKVKKGVKPNVELAPAHPSKVSATIDLNVDRQDVHAVTVAVYPADTTKDAGSAATTVNIGTVPEVSLRVAKDPLEKYLKTGKETERKAPAAAITN